MHNDTIVTELVAIKKLLVLALVNSGMTQDQVAGALSMDRSNVSRMFPKGALNQKAKGGSNERRKD